MAATPSAMKELGTIAPDFNLYDTVSGEMKSLNQLKSEKATVVMFICNHCPYVIHINKELVKTAKEYIQKGVSFIAVSSNDVENYPQDSPEKMKDTALENDYPFPYLYDETQETAKDYNAECTPDIFVYNSEMKLAYRGQFDSSRPKNNEPVTGKDLRNALDAVLGGREVDQNQIPSIGCNIKWKK